MATENGFNGDTNLHKACTSKSQETSKGDEKTNTVPFHKLFVFADSTDILLMIVGTVGAVGNGLCMPLMTILFGDLVNAFGQNQSNNQVVHVVSKV